MSECLLFSVCRNFVVIRIHSVGNDYTGVNILERHLPLNPNYFVPSTGV